MNLKGTILKIKKLDIQGASAIAKSGVIAFSNYVANGRNMEKDVSTATNKITAIIIIINIFFLFTILLVLFGFIFSCC